MSDSVGSDLSLVPEIWTMICANLSRSNLLRLRLVSHKLRDIASPFAFHSLRLIGYGDSAKRLTNIAKAPSLRSHVRELTIDTWVGPGFRYNANKDYRIPQGFMNALPYVRFFGGLTKLHFRFSEFSGDNHRDFWRMSIEETWDFRYRVLDTVFHCVTGLWTKEQQIKIDDTASLPDFEPDYLVDDLDIPTAQAMSIKELTISNLAGYHDPYLATSEAWKRLLSLPSLRDLKVLIAVEEDDASPESSVYFEEKYNLFEGLHFGWLSPCLAENLRVLSLYCTDYWGWFPKMDFRDVGSMPHLKVLALGKYVFSHEWQIDFFASIGTQNGNKGLEELYLDDCFVLYRAHQRGLESDGYPDTYVVMDRREECETLMFTLRWHHLLSYWAMNMVGLKELRISEGRDHVNAAFVAAQQDEQYSNLKMEELVQCVEHNEHRHFDFSEPVRNGHKVTPDADSRGSGIFHEQLSRMQYLEYDIGMGPSPYMEVGRADESDESDDDGEYVLLDVSTQVKDAIAYKHLLDTVRRNSF